MSSEVKNLRSRMFDNERFLQTSIQKGNDLEKQMMKNEESMKMALLDQSKDLKVELTGINTSFELFKTFCNNKLSLLDELQTQLKWTI